MKPNKSKELNQTQCKSLPKLQSVSKRSDQQIFQLMGKRRLYISTVEHQNQKKINKTQNFRLNIQNIKRIAFFYNMKNNNTFYCYYNKLNKVGSFILVQKNPLPEVTKIYTCYIKNKIEKIQINMSIGYNPFQSSQSPEYGDYHSCYLVADSKGAQINSQESNESSDNQSCSSQNNDSQVSKKQKKKKNSIKIQEQRQQSQFQENSSDMIFQLNQSFSDIQSIINELSHNSFKIYKSKDKYLLRYYNRILGRSKFRAGQIQLKFNQQINATLTQKNKIVKEHIQLKQKQIIMLKQRKQQNKKQYESSISSGSYYDVYNQIYQDWEKFKTVHNDAQTPQHIKIQKQLKKLKQKQIPMDKFEQQQIMTDKRPRNDSSNINNQPRKKKSQLKN